MTQYSSEQIKAQIAELQKTQILMELLEKKFPRKKKNRLTFLPYDCVENIYDFMGDNEVAQYRLAKAVSKTHNDLTSKCYKSIVYKFINYSLDCVSDIKHERKGELRDRMNKLKEKVKGELKTMDINKVCRIEKSRIEEVNKIILERTPYIDDDEELKYNYIPARYFPQLKRIYRHKTKYDSVVVLSGETTLLNGSQSNFAITRDCNQPIYKIKDNDIILRIMEDNHGAKWAFLRHKAKYTIKNKDIDELYYTCHKISE